MIERTLSKKLSSLARQYPVVTVTGPRQSGKTTLTRMLFRNHEYVSLEEPNEREFALVVAELFKAFAHRGESPPLYFWRDRTGHEVDVVIDSGKKLIPIEIKAGETVVGSFFRGLRYFVALGAPVADAGVLIHGGDERYRREGFSVLPWFQVTS